jgi:hypothetical protein
MDTITEDKFIEILETIPDKKLRKMAFAYYREFDKLSTKFQIKAARAEMTKFINKQDNRANEARIKYREIKK